jgi:hypothetical protein
LDPNPDPKVEKKTFGKPGGSTTLIALQCTSVQSFENTKKQPSIINTLPCIMAPAAAKRA